MHVPPEQPKPFFTLVSNVTIGGVDATAIFRRFHPEQVSGCKLCDRCTANQSQCNIVVQGLFTAAQGKMIRTLVTQDGWVLNPAYNWSDQRGPTIGSGPETIHPPDPESSLEFFRRVMGEASRAAS